MPKVPMTDADRFRAGRDTVRAGLPFETAAGLNRLQAQDVRIAREATAADAWLAAMAQLTAVSDAGAPTGFTRNFLAETDRSLEAAVNAAPPPLRDAVAEDMSALRGQLGERAAAAEAAGRAVGRRRMLRRVLDVYRDGVAQDPGQFELAAARLTGLADDLTLPTAARAEIRDTLANAAVDGLMADPETAAAMLEQGLFDGALTSGSKVARLGEALAAADRARLLNREATRDALMAQAETGALDAEALTGAANAAGLSDAEVAQLHKAGEAARRAATARAAAIDRIGSLTGPLDPEDARDRADVDAYWQAVSPVFASEDPAAARQAELRFVRRAGVLPVALSNQYQGLL